MTPWVMLLAGVVILYLSVMVWAYDGGPRWMRRLRVLIFGCPVGCGRRRHLTFCRYGSARNTRR